jgi:hypothetical protein
MSQESKAEARREAASANPAARREFQWSASTNRGAISIVRTGQSSPVFIQANN